MSCVALILTIRALNLAVPAFYGKMVDVLSGLAPLLIELLHVKERSAQHGGIGPGGGRVCCYSQQLPAM